MKSGGNLFPPCSSASKYGNSSVEFDVGHFVINATAFIRKDFSFYHHASCLFYYSRTATIVIVFINFLYVSLLVCLYVLPEVLHGLLILQSPSVPEYRSIKF